MHVCDEVVSINGELVTSAEVSGFDCVEMCERVSVPAPGVASLS